MPNNSLETIFGASSFQEKESDLFYNLSGVYLILVGIVGGTLNIVALMKAIKVSISWSSNQWIDWYQMIWVRID